MAKSKSKKRGAANMKYLRAYRKALKKAGYVIPKKKGNKDEREAYRDTAKVYRQLMGPGLNPITTWNEAMADAGVKRPPRRTTAAYRDVMEFYENLV